MRAQAKRAIFTALDDFIDVLWDDVYPVSRTAMGTTTSDDTVPAVALSDIVGGVRVTPTAHFTGYVDLVNVEVL